MNEQQQIQQHIDAILANVENYHAQHQQLIPDEQEETFSQQRPHTIIDVYVIEQEQDDDPPTVESTLDTQTQGSQDNEEPETTTITPPRVHHRTRPKWSIIALVALCTLLVSAGVVRYFVQRFTPSASVTIVTASQQLTTTSTFRIITNGTADPRKKQVPGRALPAITMSQERTIPTTGTAHQVAQAAHGLLTLYNAAPFVQTVEAGTMLTGVDGIPVITDQDAMIPAAIMPTEGQVSVYAHTASTGPTSNIRAGDLYGPCCRLDVFVANEAFHGGQDARTYHTATPQDITSVVTTVKTSLEQSVQAALQTQVQPSETLVTPLACTSKVTPDHGVGEEATQIQVMESETCTGTTYTTQALTTLATQNATQDATTRLGTGYTTTGIHIIQAHTTNHDLEITSVSLWAYPFTQEQQSSIKAMIAGMSRDRATATVLRMAGVQSVAITLKNGTTIPTDGQQIHLLFMQM